MNKIQAIQSASYILGEGIRDEFNKKEEKAVAGGNTFFYVYNSENSSIRVDIVNGVYEMSKEYN